NSQALQIAGITRTTADPAGGKIDRDVNGEPTGILRDAAMNLVLSKIPPPSPERLRRGLELALADAARSGITSVQDNSPWTAFLVYEDLEHEGKLTARVSEWLNFTDEVSLLQTHRAHHPATDAMLHTGMLKGFMDGSLGSRTAAMLAPYSDDPGNRGLPQFEADKLNQMASERQAAGFQLGFHAIGDGGAQLALDAFDAAQRYATTHGAARDFRNRIEHAQVLTVEQMDRMAALKVIASVQPNHLLTDMHWAEQRIGPERAKHSYPWRELQQRGVRLAFGTDYPVEPITPFRGLYAAVARKDETGKNSYYPDQAISRESALLAYTSGSAYAEFAEREKGTIAPGMLADFVVLDRDLLHCVPEDILKTQVLRTVVGGKIVYETK
ncbi:MAG TPA: amidohydrolase family protein, partial [Terriglobales bacterium]